MNKDSPEDELTKSIIRLQKERKPQTVEQMVSLVRKETSLPEQKIIEHILRLRSEGKIKWIKIPKQTPKRLVTYMKTGAYWYWITLILVVTTTVTVFIIPENAYPLVFFRYILGAIFVLWLPGYTFVRALFPQIPTGKSAKSLDSMERIALSIGMSLALVPILGLILNYTPWGIRLTPITFSLLALTIIFATAAVMREHRNRLGNKK